MKTWVIYERQKQTELIDGVIAFHADVMMRGLIDQGVERERAWMSSGYSLFRFLNAIWLTFKDASWSMESEFRYVYHVFDEYLPDWCTIRTRPETGRRYIEADFGPAELKYVGIGPKNDPLTSRRWVDDILKRNGFNGVHVAQSTVSIDG